MQDHTHQQIEDLRRDLADALDSGASFGEILSLRERLGSALLDADLPLEAIEHLETAVRMRAHRGERDDWGILEIQGILGRALTEARRFEESIALLTEVVQGRTRVLGRDHTSTMVARGNLVRALGRSGRVRAAMVMADELIADRRRLLGDDHPSTFDARGHRAQLLDLAGRPEEAVVELESLLADRIRVLGAGHPVVTSTRHNLATIRSRCTDADAVESRWELEQNYAVVAEELGEDHPEALTALAVLAEHLMQIEEFADALRLLDILVERRGAVLGEDAAPTLNSRSSRCWVLWALGRTSEATNTLADVVADARRTLGQDNYQTIRSNLLLVDFLEGIVEHDPDVSEDVENWLECEMVRVTRADVTAIDRRDPVRQRVEQLRTELHLT